MSNFTFDVFISYSHADAVWVKTWLLPRLEAAGLRVCIDYRDFKLGIASLDNMTDAAVRSRKTLFVMTPSWTVSEYSQFEALVTQTIDPIGRKGRLLPLMLKDCDLSARLQILTYADFRDPGNWESELARVVKDVRKSADDEQQASRPPALAPNLVHPYPLQANFTGRVPERAELTAWLTDDERSICALVAMGGMGKSALAWYWVKNDVLTNASPSVDGVMWWSFYEGESSFARFIDEALHYVGNQPIDVERFPTTYDRAQELRRFLQTRRILFILDGFERQLRAYAALDAAYRPDDIADPSRDARSCVDPTAARLLRDIAAGATRAKLLLTTRLMPSDLEDRAGDALAGARNRELTELPRDDAVTFMRAQGVTKGTLAQIATVCAEYGYHPLSLRLLSGLIARDAHTPGDIAAAPRHDVHADLIQSQHHILEQSYNALPKRERALLSRIAAFRNPMTYNALSIFNTFSNEARFEAALEDLRARGLLQRDVAHNRYELHPIVRHYAYERLTDKRRVHSRLRDYFANITASDDDNVTSIEDLAPVIELYHHTVRAGRYDDACDLLYARLVPNPLHYRFGAYHLIIELGLVLFPGGENQPPRLKKESDRAWTLGVLGGACTLVGQPRRAALLVEQQNALNEQLGSQRNLAVGLGNVAIMNVTLGEMMTAEQNLRRAIELCLGLKEEFGEATCHMELGRLLVYRGSFEAAELELVIAQNTFRNHKTNLVSVVRAYHALSALLVGNAHTALEMAGRARTLADEVAGTFIPVERDVIWAEWLLGAALTMEGEDMSAAAKHLTDALTRCRRISLVEIEPDILLTWARWHHANDNLQEAQIYAEEALAISDRCEYRLKQAEVRNFLARLALDAGEREAARGHAEIARERAWCDGPPHCYKVALDEAEGILRELGMGE